jgi:hypothetical protein
MRQACIVAARTRWTLEQHLDRIESVYAEVQAESTGSRNRRSRADATRAEATA